VKKKSDKEIYPPQEVPEFAMKVLKKAFLVKNNHLKYAVGEANIMKQTDHPFVLRMHYSFQTPDNLYMVLDYCPGGDLS
jgi:serum/glucocorticoid-regulated kinase 2